MAPVTGTAFTGTSDLDIDVAIAQYVDNANWYGSVTKAGDFLEAIAFLKTHRAQVMEQSGSSLNFASLEAEEQEVRSYLSTHSSAINRTNFSRGQALMP